MTLRVSGNGVRSLPSPGSDRERAGIGLDDYFRNFATGV
jgi:hypothetical protein